MGKILQYLQEKVVFLPSVLPHYHAFNFKQNFEEYLWETPFEGKINVLHFQVENPKGVILYFHGNADNLHRWGKIASELCLFGYDILVMDYRGYGKSTGPRNEDYLYSDALFAFQFAKEKYGEENIIVYGRSLGGAFALKVATENQPKFIVLEAAFYNLQDMINRWLPVKVTDKVSPKMTYHFRSDESILDINVPLYHFHGSKDFVVPLKSGRKLFSLFEEAKPNIEKKFIEITGGKHDDLAKFDLFRRELKNILNQ